MTAAAKAGTIATGLTCTGLTGITATLSAPTANLGGYATAQIVASGSGASALGICGPALSSAIAAIGGPVIAALLTATGIGFLVYGIVRLFSWLW